MKIIYNTEMMEGWDKQESMARTTIFDCTEQVRRAGYGRKMQSFVVAAMRIPFNKIYNKRYLTCRGRGFSTLQTRYPSWCTVRLSENLTTSPPPPSRGHRLSTTREHTVWLCGLSARSTFMYIQQCIVYNCYCIYNTVYVAIDCFRPNNLMIYKGYIYYPFISSISIKIKFKPYQSLF